MVSRFFVTYPDAVQAMADLAEAGVPEADTSLIMSEDDARLPPEVAADSAQSPAASGAKLGAGIGGGIGVLFGVGAIAVPLFDPVVRLGWVAPTLLCALCGAALGAAFGILTRLGVTNPQAHAFAAGLQRGQVLLMVRAEESRLGFVEQVLARHRIPVPPDEPLPDDLPHEPDPAPHGEVERIRREEARLQYTSE